MHNRDLNALQFQEITVRAHEHATPFYTVRYGAILGSATISSSTWSTNSSNLSISEKTSTNTTATAKFTASHPGTYSSVNKITDSDGEIIERTITIVFESNTRDISQRYYSGTATTTGLADLNARLPISIMDPAYGVIEGGTVDTTSQVMDWIQALENEGAEGYMNEGDYLVSGSCLTITKGVTIHGAGNRSRIIVDSSVGATTDVITISPSTTSDDLNTNFVLDNFRIKPNSGTPARHGIALDITTRALYNSKISRLRIDQLGGPAIATLPHAVTPISDGFFTSVIEENILYGGIYLDKAGDSIRIRDNTITGTGVGVYADLWCNTPGVDCFDGGPHGLTIEDNNITCVDGALDVRNAHGGIFTHNVVEVPSGGTLQNNAAISIDGIVTKLTQSFMIVDNSYLTTIAGNDVVYFGYTDQCVVRGNYSVRVVGRTHYNVSANAVNTQILHCYAAGGEARTTMLTDAGTSTFWFRTWAGVVDCNQSIQIDAGNNLAFTDSAGDSFPIIQIDSSDNCDIGFTSAPAIDGYLLFSANGTERMRIVDTGQVIVGDPAFPAGLNPEASAAFQIESTTQGQLPPRMTTTQRDAISSPAEGLLIYNTTTKKLNLYTTTWEAITSV